MAEFLRLPTGIDPLPILLELQRAPHLWDRDTARTTFEARRLPARRTFGCGSALRPTEGAALAQGGIPQRLLAGLVGVADAAAFAARAETDRQCGGDRHGADHPHAAGQPHSPHDNGGSWAARMPTWDWSGRQMAGRAASQAGPASKPRRRSA